MIEDSFESWMRRMGKQTIRTKSAIWFEQGFGVVQAFPYIDQIVLTDEEKKYLLINKKKLAIRYSTPLSEKYGKISYHVIWDKPTIDIDKMSAKVRYDIKNGLKYATINPISMQKIVDEGWEARRQTIERQCRIDSESEKEWKKMWSAALGIDDFEAWGAIRSGELIGSIIALKYKEIAYILYQQSQTEHMKYGINNAIAYKFTKQKLESGSVRKVFYGMQSLDAPSSVDQFKTRMGFSIVPVRQCIALSPPIEFLSNKISMNLLTYAESRGIKAALFKKVNGMLRFYNEGKMIDREQTISPLLADESLHGTIMEKK